MAHYVCECGKEHSTAETRTICRMEDRKALYAIFKENGLRERSKSWRDYEKGKHVVADILPEDYEGGIRALSEYLGL